ncbi:MULTISPECIES: PIN domain-containing protein [Nostocales]|uniref:Uncharacterized protein n=2 Tax=Nostocales TaxID=1161 RepID=A0ABW8WQ75_9CYAN|nr:hypothetical protein [Tolypothrix bouteillei]
MSQDPVLLDTDTLSLILRQNPLVLAKAQSYLAQHSRFTFSIITRYKILRGLKAILQGLSNFCTLDKPNKYL